MANCVLKLVATATSLSTCGLPSNTWFLCPSKPKRHLDRFSRFCTAHRRVSLYFTMGLTVPSKLPFPWGIWNTV